MFARRFIDNLDFARKGMELRGEIGMAEMPRMQDTLFSPEGQVAFVLRGLLNRNGKPMLEIELNGMCQLLCQRCLQGLPYRIEMVSHLLPVAEEELDGSSPDEEEMERIPAQTNMNVQELIEEEILLNLPLAPKHEIGACPAGNIGFIKE